MKSLTLKRIRLEITFEDIEEMYDRYDSGMADPSTTNAVCLALRRKLRPECRPRVIFTSNQVQTCVLQVCSEHFPLSPDLCWWLDHSNKGHLAEPAVFTIELPEAYLLPEVAPTNHRRVPLTLSRKRQGQDVPCEVSLD